jgi:distribution and morphology protein 10
MIILLIICAPVSTGVRFTTLPDATPPSFQLPSGIPPLASKSPYLSGPPTTMTAVFNPMMGHLSGAYASRVARNLTLGSRFDFNIYSYESEWTMGLEWWLRRSNPSPTELDANSTSNPNREILNPISSNDEVQGVVKLRASTTTVGPLLSGVFSN